MGADDLTPCITKISTDMVLAMFRQVAPCPPQGNMHSEWWRRQMETFSALLAICTGNSPVSGEFPAQMASNAELWCFLWSARINGWVNNGEGGDLRRHCSHYDVIVMGPSHNNNVTWASWCLDALASQLFVLQTVELRIAACLTLNEGKPPVTDG